MAYAVTLIPGDDTGPEIAAATRRVIDALGVAIDWDEQPLDDGTIPDRVVESLVRTKVGLMAYHRAPHTRNEQPAIVNLRRRLGMFANVRPVRSLPGVDSRHTDIDLVVVRETTEDIYAHLEHESIPGVFESLKVTTKAACERIARYAFEHARKNHRKKVTIVHKANIMKKSDGLFLKTARTVAEQFPDIVCDDVIVDALCMKLVISPSKFDVLVAGNLYGDIVADLCAGLAGGGTNSASINVSEDTRVFASAHGDPVGDGPDRGNSLSLLLPTVHLLRWIGEKPAGDRLKAAIDRALTEGVVPYALGGGAGCNGFADEVIARL